MPTELQKIALLLPLLLPIALSACNSENTAPTVIATADKAAVVRMSDAIYVAMASCDQNWLIYHRDPEAKTARVAADECLDASGQVGEIKLGHDLNPEQKSATIAAIAACKTAAGARFSYMSDVAAKMANADSQKEAEARNKECRASIISLGRTVGMDTRDPDLHLPLDMQAKNNLNTLSGAGGLAEPNAQDTSAGPNKGLSGNVPSVN